MCEEAKKLLLISSIFLSSLVRASSNKSSTHFKEMNSEDDVSDEHDEWLKSSFRCDVASFRWSSKGLTSKENSKQGGSSLTLSFRLEVEAAE